MLPFNITLPRFNKASPILQIIPPGQLYSEPRVEASGLEWFVEYYYFKKDAY